MSRRAGKGGLDDRTVAMVDEAHRCDLAGRHAEAAALYGRLIERIPDSWVLHNNLGSAQRALGNLSEAISSCRRATALGGDAEAYSNLGLALAEAGHLDEARAAHLHALGRKPDSAGIQCNAGAFHWIEGNPEQAESCFREAVRLAPAMAEAHLKLGATLCRANRHEEAVTVLRHAIALAPGLAEAHSFLGMALLGMGELAAGFAEYEWRRAHTPIPRMPDPAREWRGGMLEGRTVLLYCEQGLGDILQFCRYATVAAAVGGRVILLAPKELRRLLLTVPGVAEVVDDPAVLPSHDCHLPLISMAHLVGTRLDTIPPHIPYLRADPVAVETWKARLSQLPGLKVGLVWSGAPRADDREAALMDRRRSLPLARFEALGRIPGISLISLQKGPAAAEAHKPPSGMILTDYMAEIGDFAETAALVGALDLVVSVDTSVAHLAGALGKPVWVLSRFDACWRWLRNRPDSPWYPSLRVFGQPAPGDWEPVLDDVTSQLTAWAAKQQNAVVK